MKSDVYYSLELVRRNVRIYREGLLYMNASSWGSPIYRAIAKCMIRQFLKHKMGRDFLLLDFEKIMKPIMAANVSDIYKLIPK